MSDEAQTKPTLETISKQVEDLRSDMSKQMEDLRSELRTGFASINYMLEQMDIRFDRVEGVAYGAHSIAVSLRADFKAFHSQSKEAA
jgi:hypothetical protein